MSESNTPPEPFSRSVGSQGEVPQIQRGTGEMKVRGYQEYTVSRQPAKISAGRRHKYDLMRPYILGLDPSSSVLDLGCSAGVIGLTAYVEGFHRVTFADHDPEYLAVVDEVLEFLGADATCRTEETRFSTLEGEFDLVIALSIIHWLYSATEDYGSLDSILRKLSDTAKHTLLVEWVSPTDPCFDSWSPGSLDDVHSPYNFEAFHQALTGHFPHVRKVGKSTLHREIWVASMEPIAPAFSAAPRRDTARARIQARLYQAPPEMYAKASAVRRALRDR